jgi:hypothetical protein
MFENTNHFIPKDVIVINLFVCEELRTSCYVRKNTTSNKDPEEKKDIECKKEKKMKKESHVLCEEEEALQCSSYVLYYEKQI